MPVIPAKNDVRRKRMRRNEAFELNLIRKLEKIKTKGITKARGRRMRDETLKTRRLTSSLPIKLEPSGFIKKKSKSRMRSSLQ